MGVASVVATSQSPARPPPFPSPVFGRLRADEISAKMAKRGAKPEDVAATIVRAATSRRPKDRYQVPFSAKLTVLTLPLIPQAVIDRSSAILFGMKARSDGS